MKLKALALALSMLAGAPAMAACTNTFNLGVMGPPALRVFGNDFSSTQQFEDCYNFTLAGAANGTGGTFEFDLSLLRNIDITSLSLSGGSLSAALVDTSPSSFSFSNLAAGVYQLAVIGNVTGRNGYDWLGTVGYLGTLVTSQAVVTAPVPEPETYAMLAAGLLAVSWTVRRRRNNGNQA
ncbi:MAG: FxDxF family PEP-CTERM protein [Rhizobacter sp.]